MGGRKHTVARLAGRGRGAGGLRLRGGHRGGCGGLRAGGGGLRGGSGCLCGGGGGLRGGWLRRGSGLHQNIYVSCVLDMEQHELHSE